MKLQIYHFDLVRFYFGKDDLHPVHKYRNLFKSIFAIGNFPKYLSGDYKLQFMTIQKTVVRIRGKIYEVILEDGVVTYLDPETPQESWSLNQFQDQKVMSIETAKKLVAQAVERAPHPMMTFSD